MEYSLSSFKQNFQARLQIQTKRCLARVKLYIRYCIHFLERVKVEVFKAIAYALADFNELNPVAPLQLLFEVKHEINWFRIKE